MNNVVTHPIPKIELEGKVRHIPQKRGIVSKVRQYLGVGMLLGSIVAAYMLPNYTSSKTEGEMAIIEEHGLNTQESKEVSAGLLKIAYLSLMSSSGLYMTTKKERNGE